MALSFTDYFGVTPARLAEYGAFDISLESDLPVFIDPFLLFNSSKREYQELHADIIKYLKYLRDLSSAGGVNDGTLRNLYCFKEVKQNWLGFTFMGNGGSGLGMSFARSLNAGLHDIFSNFGEETITRSSHLEKVALIRPGVGRDNISDFVTNLIKHYLLGYTEKFATQCIHPSLLREVRVPKVKFNYATASWMEGRYTLPVQVRNGMMDYVLLTPEDILTRDEIWISSSELYSRFSRIPEAITDPELRTRVDAYFTKALGVDFSHENRTRAAVKTVQEYPEVVDYYIRIKEDEGEEAAELSLERVQEVREKYRRNAEAVVRDLTEKTDFYDTPLNSYDDALKRMQFFKHYIENQDGYQLVNHKQRGLADEKSIQLYFGLIWFGTSFDVNREPNNGRGPVDFKISYGTKDKSLIEFKLASNSQLRRNIERQVEIYKQANQTSRAIKAIICYTADHERKVSKILKDLGIEQEESVVVIDARRDNKPSASKA
jgi:hypothetical protein